MDKLSELRKIKERQKSIIYQGYYRKYSRSELNADLELCLFQDGRTYYYPDIDYSNTDRSLWPVSHHLMRLECLLLDDKENRLHNDALWREKIIGAVEFWTSNDFKNPNWWQNQIGVPQVLVNIALMLEKYLGEKEISAIKRVIRRGTFHAHEGISKLPELIGYGKWNTADNWTGANLIWGAATTVKYALWLEDSELLRVAVDRLADEIKFSLEGIREDGAFCQHGPRWYSGGYGRSFVYELAPIIRVLSGTEFDLPKEKVDIILHHILDGQRGMMRKGVFDYGAVGREYARPGALFAGILIKGLRLIKDADGISRRDELHSFYNELVTGEDSHEITRYYPSIAQLCHKKNGIYIGVRGRSEGIHGAEICNNEAVLSYNMSYGTYTCVMESGREYFDISPCWDYSKIPGTTARNQTDKELLSYENWNGNLETPCRAYGKSDGDCGVLTEFTAHDGISMTSTYFVFDGAMVALGTDIKDDTPEKGELFTTVEQCVSDSSSFDGDIATNGKVIYKNLDANTKFNVQTTVREGSWRRNHGSLSDEGINMEIFSVLIPKNEYDKYAYLVSGEKEVDVEVLKNDSLCQAVIFGGDKLMAVFHHDCVIEVGDRIVEGKKGDIILK